MKHRVAGTELYRLQASQNAQYSYLRVPLLTDQPIITISVAIAVIALIERYRLYKSTLFDEEYQYVKI